MRKIVEFKFCSGCGKTLPRSDFYRLRPTHEKVTSRCKLCMSRQNRQWRERNREHKRTYDQVYSKAKRESGAVAAYLRKRRQEKPDIYKAINKRWENKNRDRNYLVKLVARIVRNALRTGDLRKGEVCDFCGEQNIFLEAAHADYSKPLDVRWLCRPCHRKWDRREPKSITALALEPKSSKATQRKAETDESSRTVQRK